MKKGHIYTAVFMIILSAVLTFALALAYESFKPAIKGHKELAEQRAILYAFDLDNGLTDDQVAVVTSDLIAEITLGEKMVPAHVKDDKVVAYAVPFTGSGLWGSILGYLGVTADLSETTGIVFTSQNETPGLGGRIEEEQFKGQFRGVPIGPDTELKYVKNGGEIDAVTGATQTSDAVLRMLNAALRQDVFGGEVQE